MVILFDQFNLPDDVYDIVFATEQQVVVAKMLIAAMKRNQGVFTKSEMSEFANNLHDGVPIDASIKAGDISLKTNRVMSYNKRQFYDRILTPMKSMGLIDYDLYKKVYRLSDKFSRMMERVGKMWVNEARK
ncbi:MAG: hypothetical protein ACOCWQ_06315 [Nanoarchaeota archaeon]